MSLALFRRPPADPDHLLVAHAGRSYRVSVRRRPNARRITLRVSGTTGEVVLSLPMRAALATATRFLAGHGGWIAARLARVPERVAFAPGASVPVAGEPHRIVLGGAGRGAGCRAAEQDGAPVLVIAGGDPAAAGRVRRFLHAAASRDLAAAVSRHAAALGVRPGRITLRDTRSRWGSCSSSGALSFSWRLAMAPPFVLDYLAAHEVAHLAEMNHSARFWRLVHGLCPRTDEAEAWLKRHGTALHRYG